MRKSTLKSLKGPRVEEEGFSTSLALVEAALYAAGRPLDLKALRPVLKARSEDEVRQLVRSLAKEYESRSSALEVVELSDGRFALRLRAEYVQRVRKVARRLPPGLLRTLSYIAYRQPIPQRSVAEVRGSHVYRHVRRLEDAGFIVKEKVGKDVILRTTELFADAFGLSRDIKVMKKQLEEMVKPCDGISLNQGL